MTLRPYLNFDGNAREAFEYYARVLGGQIVFQMTFADSPMADQAAPADRDRMLHICMQLGDQLLMASDSPTHMPFPGISGSYTMLDVESPEEADRVFAALADGGQIEMPIQETFWARRYGIAKDRFGVPWMINCSKPMEPA